MCGMIGCPNWVSILGLHPTMCESWTRKASTGTGDDGTTQGNQGVTAINPSGECVAQTQAKSFSENTCVSSKLVGVYDMREDWVQTLRDQGLVKVQYVGGQANKANLLTKCL